MITKKHKRKDFVIVGIARFESEAFDLYYDGVLIFHSKANSVLIKDCYLTYEGIYLSMEKDYYHVKNANTVTLVNTDNRRSYMLK